MLMSLVGVAEQIIGILNRLLFAVLDAKTRNQLQLTVKSAAPIVALLFTASELGR